MLRWIRELPRVGLAVCLLLSGCGTGPTATAQPEAKSAASPVANSAAPVSPEAPQVTLKILSLAQLEQLIAGYRGRVVVLDVWSSSCAPCIKEFPNLVALSRKYEKKDVVCLSLNLDFYGGKNSRPQDFEAHVLKRLTAWGATFDNVLSQDEDQIVLQKLNLTAPPGVFVYGRDGKLARAFNNDAARTEREYFTYEQVGQTVAEQVGKK